MKPSFALSEMPCTGGQCKCPHCGATAVKPAKGFVMHGCKLRPATRGLGDMVASVLSSLGITKERVSKAIGKPCGCEKRQAALNALGRRLGIG